MRVGANQDNAGLGEAELRSGDMENALPIVAPTESGDFVFVCIAYQKLDHIAYSPIGNAGHAPCPSLRVGRDVVIRKRKDLVRVCDRKASLMERVECMP